MSISIKDLIPSTELVEKSTLRIANKENKIKKEHYKKREQPVVEEAESIFSLPVESTLEEQLAKIRYSQEEIQKAKEKRAQRLRIDLQIKKNQWNKKIKSKAHRKRQREQKQKRMAEAIQIKTSQEAQESDFSDDDTSSNAPRHSQTPEPMKIVPEDVSKAIKLSETQLEDVSDRQEISPELKVHSILSQRLNTKPIIITNTYNTNSDNLTATNTNSNRHNNSSTQQSAHIESILGVDQEFTEEKQTAVTTDIPLEREEIIPGWNTWGGESIEPRKNNANTTVIKRTGIQARHRKDFKVSHVIYNERMSQTRNQKYGIKTLPAGYQSTEEYTDLLEYPLSVTHQPTNILNKLLKDRKEEN
ncbi:hypothetical protein NEOKW01_1690 [Nematocida sp. AWRm80]|nr:hypothetical protein NEOKW01_1690 [Nematocida sp. AWRm80]